MEKERAFIYRYYRIDDYLYDSIVKGYTYFPNPNFFNDPFDTKLPTRTTGSKEDYRKMLTEMDIDKKLTEQQIEDQAKMMFENPDSTHIAVNSLLQSVISKIGVACFTKHNDNILMWSHYASKHEGVCIKYDLDKLVVRNVMKPLMVKYLKPYPEYNYLRGDRTKLAEEILGTKSEDWSYESELRIISQKQGENIVKKEALVEVIFGCKSDITKAKIVSTLFRQNGYKVVFTKAHKKDDSFGIRFEDLGS